MTKRFIVDAYATPQLGLSTSDKIKVEPSASTSRFPLPARGRRNPYGSKYPGETT